MSRDGAREVAFACRCGAVAGTVAVEDGAGFHFACHCGDCRGAALLSGAPDPGTGGVAIWQTTPDRLRIERGAERLEPLRMRPGAGLLRWRAACCGDVILATGRGPGLPFVGIAARALSATAPLGPQRARTFLPARRPGGRQRNEGLAGFVAGMLRRTLSARLSGRWRSNPLAGPDGRYPRPRDLTREERRAAYP